MEAKYLFCLLIFSANNLFAQEQAYFFHYPLNIGDRWEYERIEIGSFVTTATWRVIGDTLLQNGENYRILEQLEPSIGVDYLYQRVVDSVGVFQFYERRVNQDQRVPDEFLLFKLTLKDGDSWKIPIMPSAADSAVFRVTQIADTVLFSHAATIVHLVLRGEISDRFISIVDSVGVFSEAFEGLTLELKGAIINNQPLGNPTSVRISGAEQPDESSLLKNYPNPFNRGTTIRYQVDSSDRIKVVIFNILGSQIKVLVDSIHTQGAYRVDWLGNDESGRVVASGIYILSLETSNRTLETKTILFLK